MCRNTCVLSFKCAVMPGCIFLHRLLMFPVWLTGEIDHMCSHRAWFTAFFFCEGGLSYLVCLFRWGRGVWSWLAKIFSQLMRERDPACRGTAVCAAAMVQEEGERDGEGRGGEAKRAARMRGVSQEPSRDSRVCVWMYVWRHCACVTVRCTDWSRQRRRKSSNERLLRDNSRGEGGEAYLETIRQDGGKEGRKRMRDQKVSTGEAE